MRWQKELKTEKGLTLIEVLASTIIITIILVSFLTILLQATKHSKYNEEKLVEVDIAEKVIGEIRDGIALDDVVQSSFYHISIACEEGPNDLTKLEISVQSNEERGQKKSPFITETYVKGEEACP